jgi:hypothetical protein
MIPKHYATGFYLPASVTATSETAGYEDDYLASIVAHPVTRHWRSTVTTQTDIVVDLGSSKSVAAVALLGANFTSVQLAHDADNVDPYTDVTGSPFTITRRLPGGYYNRLVNVSWTNRYLRVRIPTQTPTGGESYFKLGAVLLLSSALTTLVRVATPGMGLTLLDPQTESGSDMAPSGPLSVQHEWRQLYQASEMTPFWNFGIARRHTPVLWYDDAGGTFEKIWLSRFIDSVSMRVEHGNAGTVRYEVNPRMKELV